MSETFISFEFPDGRGISFFCSNCALWSEDGYCPACGRNLVPPVNERAPTPSRADGARANEKGTQ